MNSNLKKFFIASTLCFTICNILPTSFYYSKDLEKPVSFKKSHSILKSWQKKFLAAEKNTIDWLQSFAKGMNIELERVVFSPHSHRHIIVEFKKEQDMAKFESNLAQSMQNLPYKQLEMRLAGKDKKILHLIKKYPSTIKGLQNSSYLSPLDISDLSENFKNFAQTRYQNIQSALYDYDFFKDFLSISIQPDAAAKELEKFALTIQKYPELKKRLGIFYKTRGSVSLDSALKTLKNYGLINPVIQDFVSYLNQAVPDFGIHPVIEKSEVVLSKNLIIMQPYQDFGFKNDSSFLTQIIQNFNSHIKQSTNDDLLFFKEQFHITILPRSQSSVLLSKLDELAQEQISDIKQTILQIFHPTTSELQKNEYPIVSMQEFFKLSPLEQESCFILHSPLLKDSWMKHAAKDSFYLVAKNLDKLVKDYEKSSSSESKVFLRDYKAFIKILHAIGFEPTNSTNFGSEFRNDLIFECKSALKMPLDLLNEKYQLKGHYPYAANYLGILKDRIHQETLQDVRQQNIILDWSDHYHQSLSKQNGLQAGIIAEPTSHPLVSKMKLKLKQFFSGTELNTIKFGLDLSGGKHILIQIEDATGKKISDETQIKTAINELYARVNKLGVSEVSIRQEGDYISLDFPGSQNLSAKDLVNASDMYFHVVNEEFSYQNPDLYPYVQDFLVKVWQKAKKQNTFDQASLQKIGIQILHSQEIGHLSSQKLLLKGLRLADPHKDMPQDHLDYSLSKIVMLKPSDKEDQQDCPLMIVFHNYALEGSALKDVQCSYDATKGNFLSFNIQKTSSNKFKITSPQEVLSKWTTAFTKSKNSMPFQPQRGWRMAVLLNSEVVSAPVLESALKDAASINGSFTQQDLLKLKSDLLAGAMSFKPKIISEQNIAPELGVKDRQNGFLSLGISLVLVTVLMTSYYRFHGLIATGALCVNLLMLLAAVNYFQVTLSLASIAGIILTLGMAVDANVLIYERMREEENRGAAFPEIVKKGYHKAFSAIIDSNLTTMIAAFVLLGFDAGPIKGFALTLLLGLITSVITALFFTKFFYFEWIKKTMNHNLRFTNWFKIQGIQFLSKSKKAMIVSLFTFVLGAFCFAKQANNIIGMDFKGGYALDLILQESSVPASPKNLVLETFLNLGLKSSHIQIKELSNSHHLRVVLDHQVDKIKPAIESWSSFFSDVLNHKNLKIKPESLAHLDASVTTISGQLSQAMTQQAIFGLGFALLSIFAYLLIRFHWSYALAATIGLIHDVILTLAFMGLLAFCGVPINLDMSSLAALLTIIGYSLNDTIIVFDRIREELQTSHSYDLKALINKCLNITLSRTLLTSLTTLVVLIPMLFVGQGTLLNFSLVMTLGVIIGTLSTLYIASPLLLFFKKQDKMRVKG